MVFVVSEDWAFLTFRLPMARAARSAGMQVSVIAQASGREDEIRAEGFDFHPVTWKRQSLNPVALIREVVTLTRLFRRIKPDLVHSVALRIVLMVGLAARFARVGALLSAFTGLGYVFTGQGAKVRALRMIAGPLLRIAVRGRRRFTLFQNADDQATLQRFGLVDANTSFLIRGSGIDVDHFGPIPSPATPPVVFGFVGRLLGDKGVRELTGAYRILSQEHPSVGLLVAGTADAGNPTVLTPAEIDRLAGLPGVEMLGHVADVREIWSRAHVAVLPSYREGLPKSLLEAAACARPIIATDVPGCREICRDGETGILVPAREHQGLLQAMRSLRDDAELRETMAVQARASVLADLSADAVGKALISAYAEMLSHPASSKP